jgi:hypothetical protein
MSDYLGDAPAEDALSESAGSWDTVRRVREPVAWILLVIPAIWLVVSAGQLFGLASVPLPIPSPARMPVFELRAAAVAQQFVSGGILVLPVLSVILVAFLGGLTARARLVVKTAVAIQAVALILGVISWLGAAGVSVRPGPWFIFVATDIAAVAAGLVFTVAVLRSPALRPLLPQFEDDGDEADDEDFTEDDADPGEEAGEEA